MCLILLIFGNDRSNVLFLLLPWVFAVSTLLHGHFFCICESDIGLFADKGALLLGQKDALSDSVSHFGMTLCQLLDHSLSPLALDWPPDPWFSQEISFEVLKADWAWKSGLEFHCQIFSERKSLVKSIITRAKTKYFEDHILMVSSTTELLGFIKSSPLPCLKVMSEIFLWESQQHEVSVRHRFFYLIFPLPAFSGSRLICF